jgi:hypothetical protein
MAQLANCPHCEHELLIPDEVSGDSRLRCPSCRASFQLSEASSREIKSVDVTDDVTEEPGEDVFTRQTVADLPSMATWEGENVDDSERTTEPFEPQSLHIAHQDDEGEKYELLNLAENETIDFTIGEKDDDLTADFKFPDLDEHDVPPTEEEQSQTDGLHVAKLDDESIDLEHPSEESPEAAAQRIDAWFRSAKTLADVPAIPKEDAEQAAAELEDGLISDRTTIRSTSSTSTNQNHGPNCTTISISNFPRSLSASHRPGTIRSTSINCWPK